MQKIIVDLGYDKQKNKEEIKPPKCWICNDTGLAIYINRKNGIDYETAARCKCKEGQITSEAIPTIHDLLAEKIAAANFKDFSERYPDKVKELIKEE